MSETFEGWAVLELMGHRRLGGYIREEQVAGAAFIRIDIPEHARAACTCGSSDPESTSHEDHTHECLLFQAEEAAPVDVHATQMYASAAVYCITPTTEATARAVAQLGRPRPVQRWELEAPREPAPVGAEEDEPF